MPLSFGDKLGPYEILAPIGAGGMGQVYRAHDSRLNRDVAIKVSAAQFSERFEREAKAIAALNHSNILPSVRRWTTLSRHGVDRGDAVQGTAASRSSIEVCRTNLRCPRRRAQEGHHASRSEAREHSRHQSRNQAAGFRPRQTEPRQ